MRELVEFDADGVPLLVQVDVGQAEAGRARASARGDGTILASGQRFEDATAVVRPAAETLIRQVRSLSVVPDEISVDMGLSMSLKAGAFIASSTAEANFVIRMTWRRGDLEAAGEAGD
jgi:hypothetical protein